MKINRNGTEFELTPEELAEAWEEEQTRRDVESVRKAMLETCDKARSEGDYVEFQTGYFTAEELRKWAADEDLLKDSVKACRKNSTLSREYVKGYQTTLRVFVLESIYDRKYPHRWG